MTTPSRQRGSAGFEVAGVPVDRDGIRVDVLRETDADAVVLTPSHQWPTGSVLSAQNRAAVLRWAGQRGPVVIEDDYDAEYRYDRTPVGAMQGLARDHVVYAGSASKTLAPGLRLGWLVLRRVRPPPAAHAPGLPPAPRRAAGGPGAAAALARAVRHLRRPAPGHLAAADLDETTVVGAALRAGVGIDAVGPYRIAGPGPGGLIFGYATATEQAISEGVDILARVISQF